MIQISKGARWVPPGARRVDHWSVLRRRVTLRINRAEALFKGQHVLFFAAELVETVRNVLGHRPAADHHRVDALSPPISQEDEQITRAHVAVTIKVAQTGRAATLVAIRTRPPVGEQEQQIRSTDDTVAIQIRRAAVRKGRQQIAVRTSAPTAVGTESAEGQ